MDRKSARFIVALSAASLMRQCRGGAAPGVGRKPTAAIVLKRDIFERTNARAHFKRIFAAIRQRFARCDAAFRSSPESCQLKSALLTQSPLLVVAQSLFVLRTQIFPLWKVQRTSLQSIILSEVMRATVESTHP